jgi:caspase domain-containing protein/N-acetylmuramoyl-L-alanine amidase-like protein
MIGAITRIDPDQLHLLLQRAWVRRIGSVHIHHTWRPSQAQWRGESTVEAIRRFHVETNGWSDIAQHLTIGPDGSLWTGRHLDMPPASVAGHNGSASEGPFMIEMVGDFDIDRDTFGGVQADAVYRTVADICAAFRLDVAAIRFHNEFTNAKTCPGTSLDLADFRAAVAKAMPKKAAKAAPMSDDARGYIARAAAPLPAERALQLTDAEPPYDARQAAFDWSAAGDARGFGAKCSESEIEVFRKHVVNLSGGQLSQDGCYANTEADLDKLIANLGRWVGARAGKDARVMFFAHGGLVNEQGGLGICLRDYQWWLANNVYPVFFVWETGFLEIFEQKMRSEQEGQRAFFTDPVIEATLGPTVGRPTWSPIKDSAVLASALQTGTGRPGGAAIFAAKVVAWFGALQGPVKSTVSFHAAGHSAGSIFHCSFIPRFVESFKGVAGAPNPPISTLAFLAPAVRCDVFKQLLMPHVGSAVGAMSMFTMMRSVELEDNVARIYRKSLLYFVRNACENPTPTPILGLEESVRADADLVAFFGLGTTKAKADLVWSETNTESGRSASRSRSHGGFDNDVPTMNSVMRRVLGLADADPLPMPRFKIDDVSACAGSGRDLGDGGPPTSAPARALAAAALSRSGAGTRKALCVGIDSYGAQSLAGCVNDVRSFGDSLRQWGFAVSELTNERATRNAILAGIDSVLTQSSAGDIVVIVYAGHGTQLQDANGDESDGLDEAWVPYDYAEGEFVIDDDLGAALDRHRDRGIELVLFVDCCHSGTSTRAMFTTDAPQRGPRSRYMAVPPDIVRRHLAKRGSEQSGARSSGKDPIGWEIHFAACQDTQSAYEHDGHGNFTRAATAALAAALAAETTYGALGTSIAGQFAGDTLQTPKLRAPKASEQRRLFAAQRGTAAVAPAAAAVAPANTDIAAKLDQLIEVVTKLGKQIEDIS